MQAALTIAVPTYNRAELLDRQLAWLAIAVKGVRQEVVVVLSDNASTDHTWAVVERWRTVFEHELGADRILVRRHARNLGAMGNIAWGIRNAPTSHVWVISDDDAIDLEAVEEICKTLSVEPNLALLALNFSSRVLGAKKPLMERCFDVDDDRIRPNGEDVFVRCVAPRAGIRWGGMVLTTALVYRTDLARAAIDAWPDGLSNTMVQLYWTGYCAARGPARVTRRTYLECSAGSHHFTEDVRAYFKLRSGDASEAFARLAQDGIAPTLMLRKIIERPGAFGPLLLPCLRRDPVLVGVMLGRWLRAMSLAAGAVVRGGHGDLLAALQGARRDWVLGNQPWSRR